MRRKGELSDSGVDRDWPYQVAVRRAVADALGHIPSSGPYSSLCWRTRSILDAGTEFRLYCFSDPAQAETFRAFTGGEMFHPGDRWAGKWVRGRGAGREAKRAPWGR